jgi:hypothetical protein
MEKYIIALQWGNFRIIGDGPITEEIDNSEHGGYEYFIYNLRVEDKSGEVLSPVIGRLPFSFMWRSGADLDEQYGMEGFYLTKDGFGYLKATSWKSLTNPLEWNQSRNYAIPANQENILLSDADKLFGDLEPSYNEIDASNIELLNIYMEEILFFNETETLKSSSSEFMKWEPQKRILSIEK